MFGLKASDIECIIEVLDKYPEIEEAVIFGSRAMDKHKKGSDIDIALKGKELESTVTEVMGKLNNETPLPYIFDILDYRAITNIDLKNHIDRVGIAIYKKG